MAARLKTSESCWAYNRLTAEVQSAVDKAKKAKWVNTCEKLDLVDGRKVWRLLDALSGAGKTKNSNPLTTPKGQRASEVKRARALNKHFAQVNKKGARSDFSRTIDRMRKEGSRRQSKGPQLEVFAAPFTMTELQTALNKCQAGKAPGPDKVHNEMLKHLGRTGRMKLLSFINRTWTTGTLPKLWKKATITPIPKEGKPGEHPSSYRPISLTSCVGKVAERLVNARLYWFLEQSKCIPMTQGGFRKGRQPMDQALRLIQTITNELQLRNHTVAVFFDLNQAYDKV